MWCLDAPAGVLSPANAIAAQKLVSAIKILCEISRAVFMQEEVGGSWL